MTAAALAAGLLAAASCAADYRVFDPSLKEKSYGVLLLGEGGGPEWRKLEEAVAHVLRPIPVAAAWGLADAKLMQKRLEGLEARRVAKVVGVPIFVSSYGEMMDQYRYLFGIREKPPEALLNARHARRSSFDTPRLKSRVPLVLAKALDDHPIVVEILAARAKALRRSHERGGALLLIGSAPADQSERKEWLAAASGLAEKARLSADFAAARAAGVRVSEGQREREAGERELKEAAMALRRHGPVSAVSLEISAGGLERSARRALDGLFVRQDYRPLLPDRRIARWATETAAKAAALPDMRTYKDHDGLEAVTGRKP